MADTYQSKYTGAEIDARLGEAEKIAPHMADKLNPHEVTKAQVGLGDVDNTPDATKPLSNAAIVALAGKVDKVANKGLSANDYTDQDRDKLAGIEEGAEVNPEIVDNLTTNDGTKVLSAKQGKVLEDGKIAKTAIANTLTETAEGKVLDARQGKALKDDIDGKVSKTDVVNTLTETAEGKVLDARQGKVLADIVSTNIADIADLVKGKNAALNLPASWEQGTLNTPPISHMASNSRIRTGYMEISPSETYTISVGEGYMCWCPEYDTDYAVTARGVGLSDAFNALTFTSTATTKYVRIVVYKKETAYDSTNPDDYIVPNDIVNVDIKLHGKGWIFTNEELADLVSTNFSYSKGEIISDVTLTSAWKTGTATIDTGTGVITLPGHGFTNNTPVEFSDGTGVLPTGIEAYDKEPYWGEYYNVINVSGDTFQITATVGGTSPVIPSDAGTAGWQVRSAGDSFFSASIGGNMDNGKSFEITAIVPFVKITNQSMGLAGHYARFQTYGTGDLYTSAFYATLNNPSTSIGLIGNPNAHKHSQAVNTIRLTKLNDIVSFNATSIINSANTRVLDAKGAMKTDYANSIAYGGLQISGLTNAIFISSGWVSSYILRNGTRIIVRRVNV